MNPSSLKMNVTDLQCGTCILWVQSWGSAGRIKQGLFTQHLSLHNTQLLSNLNFSFTACPSSGPSFHFPMLMSYPVCLLSGVCLFATPWTVAHQTAHGISQARILDWVAISSCRDLCTPRHWTCISWISCIGRGILYHLATWEAWPLTLENHYLITEMFNSFWFAILIFSFHKASHAPSADTGILQNTPSYMSVPS